mgnify:CR=1 FL=1
MANQTTPAIQVKDSNVGIGTTSPSYKLTVNGSIGVISGANIIYDNYEARSKREISEFLIIFLIFLFLPSKLITSGLFVCNFTLSHQRFS